MYNDQQNSGFNNKYKTSLCNNFSQTGQCKFGDNCKFAHGDQDLRMGQDGPQQGFKQNYGGYNNNNSGGGGGFQQYGGSQPCRFFQQYGNCKFGDECKFSHDGGEQMGQQQQQMQQQQQQMQQMQQQQQMSQQGQGQQMGGQFGGNMGQQQY